MDTKKPVQQSDQARGSEGSDKNESEPELEKSEEVGGPKGPEPTRFGDWERKGRCIDF